MAEYGAQIVSPALPPSDTDEDPVDISQLYLFTDGNREEEKAIATLFLEQANEMIAILQSNRTRDRCTEWKSAAHRFKGASGNLGAMKLFRLCEYAETHYEHDETGKVEMLMAIQQETRRVEKYFQH